MGGLCVHAAAPSLLYSYTYVAFYPLQTRWAVYVERNIVTLSRNHCYHRNATVFFPCIVDLHLAVSNIKPFRDAQNHLEMRNKSIPKVTVYLFHKDNGIFSSQISYMLRPNMAIIRLATRKKIQIFSQLYWE